jgi:hypothetical protein
MKDADLVGILRLGCGSAPTSPSANPALAASQRQAIGRLAIAPIVVRIAMSSVDRQQTGKAARTAGIARDVPSRRLGVSPSMDELIYDFERSSSVSLCEACCPNRLAGA